MNIKGYTGESDSDEDDEEDYDGRENVMGVDDEETGEKPARKLSSSGGKKLSQKKKSLFKKPAENSVKKPDNRAKSLIKRSVSK